MPFSARQTAGTGSSLPSLSHCYHTLVIVNPTLQMISMYHITGYHDDHTIQNAN